MVKDIRLVFAIAVTLFVGSVFAKEFLTGGAPDLTGLSIALLGATGVFVYHQVNSRQRGTAQTAKATRDTEQERAHASHPQNASQKRLARPEDAHTDEKSQEPPRAQRTKTRTVTDPDNAHERLQRALETNTPWSLEVVATLDQIPK